MHSTDTVVGISETPWGLTWAELLPSLRPSRSHTALVESAAEQVSLALQRAELPVDRVVVGGPCGRGTQSAGDVNVELYAIFASFDARDYVGCHLQPMLEALTVTNRSPFSNVVERGLSVEFSFHGLSVRLFAAGVLYGGAKDLLLPDSSDPVPSDSRPGSHNAGGGAHAFLEPREVHIQTSCAVMRIEFLYGQPPMYKDMVRVAKKWRESCDFHVTSNAPGDYLLELIMLEAFQGAPAAAPGPDQFATIFRRFLSILASQSGAGAHFVGTSDMPKTFIAWTTFYNQGAIDYAIAHRLLQPLQAAGDRRSLCVLDPTVPFIDVAGTIEDWSEVRKFARDSLAHFQNTEMIEVLQAKLNHFSITVEETLKNMRSKLQALESIESSPRRWSGNIQFSDVHIASDSWAAVHDVELRCMKWRINVRRSRSDATGYSRTVDVSLQVLLEREEKLPRTINVDVIFQGQNVHLVFGPTVDHVSIARRSEVIRNREYAVQITVVA